ncbi:MAG: sensor histidine kinase [Eubacteriales bacterium]|nr:sensor histidine kinase [Eubacteriales bacterium]
MIRRYAKEHWAGLIGLGFTVLIFYFVFRLYELPAEAVLYAAAISLFFGGILVAYDFCRFCRRHRELQEKKETILCEPEKLPDPERLLEEDYQELLKNLSQELERITKKAERERSEQVQYYTMWTHQIKTPIAAMRLLLQEQDTPEYRELSDALFDVEQYVEMVLQYLRLDGTMQDLMLQSYRLDDIVRQAVRKYARLFVRKRIRLHFEPFEAQVLTDEKWMVFVVEQLLSNALKYTPASGDVTIRLEEPKTLVIADTGIGIAPEDLPRVFERGYTGFNGRMDKKSTGIGLYLCREICRKLSHRIWLKSEPGKGTEVRICMETVELPLE